MLQALFVCAPRGLLGSLAYLVGIPLLPDPLHRHGGRRIERIIAGASNVL